MDVTATLSLGDPLEPARKATAEMLQTRERTYSLPQPFYTDERLFQIDMQEIFQKEWLIAGMTCEIPAKGNYITLISNAGAKGVSTVDTEVAKQIVLPEGPYAHMNMILLNPDLNSLSVTDQRKKSRTKIGVPVAVSFPEETVARLCTIVDISDGELRIRVSERGTTMPLLQRGEGMILQVELGEAERQYTIKGVVIRRSAETCVIQMEGQIRNGQLAGFSSLDLLELKAGLLNYGK